MTTDYVTTGEAHHAPSAPPQPRLVANARLDLRPMQYKPLRAVHSNRSRYLPAWQYKPLQVFLAAAADTGGDRKKAGGVYFDVMKAVKATEAATDPELARKLWQVSEKLTGTKIDL